MAVNVDIFNPQKTVIAKGLEGKSFLIYGSIHFFRDVNIQHIILYNGIYHADQ